MIPEVLQEEIGGKVSDSPSLFFLVLFRVILCYVV